MALEGRHQHGREGTNEHVGDSLVPASPPKRVRAHKTKNKNKTKRVGGGGGGEKQRARERFSSNGLFDLSECSYQHTQHGTQKQCTHKPANVLIPSPTKPLVCEAT